MYNVIIVRSAQKDMRTLPADYYKRIVERIRSLAENPRSFGCVKLSGSIDGYRVRVGVYRIIYTINDDILTIKVIKIDHRSSIYKK